MKDSDFEDVSDTEAEITIEDLEADSLDFDDESTGDEDTAEEQSGEDTEEEDTEESEDPEESESEDEELEDLMFDLPNGEQVNQQELIDGYLRQNDYTHKTEELAAARKEVADDRDKLGQRVQFVETAYDGLLNYLQTLIPEEPGIDLAQSDPQAYQYQKAMRDQVIKELGGVVNQKKELDQGRNQFSQEDFDKYVATQEAELVKAMPALSDPIRRNAFDAAIKKTGEMFGFSEQEITGAKDHRLLQLVHYAGIGKKSEQNRNNAKRRVQAPKKGKAKPAQRGPNEGSREAFERLNLTGSIEDATRIDFD